MDGVNTTLILHDNLTLVTLIDFACSSHLTGLKVSLRRTRSNVKQRLATFASSRSCCLLEIGQPFMNNFVKVLFSNRSWRLRPVAMFRKFSVTSQFGCFASLRILCKRILMVTWNTGWKKFQLNALQLQYFKPVPSNKILLIKQML